MYNNLAHQDRKDVERLTGELAKCEEEVQMLRAGLARAQEGLAERGAALATFADSPDNPVHKANTAAAVAGQALSAIRYEAGSHTVPVRHRALRGGDGMAFIYELADKALSAPALSRAVALDRARRELCAAAVDLEEARCAVSRSMTGGGTAEHFAAALAGREAALGRYHAALNKLRALEAEPAPESAP